MKLYELAAEYSAIQQAAEEGEDVGVALELLNDDLERKGEGIVAVIRGIEADVSALKAEEKRLSERRKTLESSVSKLETYIRTCMVSGGISKIKAGTFSITVSEGSERVVIDDEAALPDPFVRVTREPNKKAILDAWKSGGECVPGTHIERGTTLRIR